MIIEIDVDKLAQALSLDTIRSLAVGQINDFFLEPLNYLGEEVLTKSGEKYNERLTNYFKDLILQYETKGEDTNNG